MKIAVAGSVTFAKELLAIVEELKGLKHDVVITKDVVDYAANPGLKLDFETERRMSLEQDVMRKFYKMIEQSDALLVCNYEKRGIKGYLGTSVLMEIGIAYYLGKKIFLLNQIDKEQNYALEVAVIDPVILDNNLNKIS